MKNNMYTRSVILEKLLKKYQLYFTTWLAGGGDWPLRISLGSMKESFVLERRELFQQWVLEWRQYPKQHQIVWEDVAWRSLKTQNIPMTLIFQSPIEAIEFIDKKSEWDILLQRFSQLKICGANTFMANRILELTDVNFEILLKLIDWYRTEKIENLFPRQLPVLGMHTKWLTLHSKLVLELINFNRENKFDSIESAFSFQSLPPMINCILLDRQLNGIKHFSTTAKDLNQLHLDIEKVIILENKETAFAFADSSKTFLIYGLGYAVNLLQNISWLQNTTVFYWGDVDTHGFAILNRLRQYLPHVKSVLMDLLTLKQFIAFTVTEPKPIKTVLMRLTHLELETYQFLLAQRNALRLEQERIPWEYCEEKLELI